MAELRLLRPVAWLLGGVGGTPEVGQNICLIAASEEPREFAAAKELLDLGQHFIGKRAAAWCMCKCVEQGLGQILVIAGRALDVGEAGMTEARLIKDRG